MTARVDRAVLAESDLLFVAFSSSQTQFQSHGSRRKAHAILEGAISAFNKRGLTTTDMDSIAREAGRPKPVLRYYFKNLSEIRLASLKYVRVLYQTHLLQHLKGLEHPESLLDAYFEACLSWPQTFPDQAQFWLHFLAQTVNDEGLKNLNSVAVETGRQRLEALIRNGICHGTFHCKDVAATAALIHCLLTGLILGRSTEVNPIDDELVRSHARSLVGLST